MPFPQMLLRPTINQLYLLSIAPNRPPHLKQPPSPNLPFSPSESIHQIIYPSNTHKACLPRQGFSIFSIKLPPHPHSSQVRPHLPLPRQGIPQSAMHQFAHFTYAFFLSSTPNHIATKQRLSLLAPKGNYHFTSPLYIRSTIHNHLAAKCVSTCPC